MRRVSWQLPIPKFHGTVCDARSDLIAKKGIIKNIRFSESMMNIFTQDNVWDLGINELFWAVIV